MPTSVIGHYSETSTSYPPEETNLLKDCSPATSVSSKASTGKDTHRALPIEQFLAVGFIGLLLFPLLFLARGADNNTLTSWQWTIPRDNFSLYFLALCLLVLTAFVTARTLPIEKIGHPLLALIAFLAVMPLWSAPEMMLDSGRYLLQARYLAENGILSFVKGWGHQIWIWSDLPLSSALYGLVLRFAGSSTLSYQILNTLLFSGAVLLTSAVGNLLWNRHLGIMSGLMLLGSPFLLTQAPQFMNDLHVMFFLVLYLYCLLRLQQSGRIWYCICPCSSALLFLSKYSVWPIVFFLPALILSTGCNGRKHPRAGLYWNFGVSLLFIGAIFFAFKDVFLSQIHLLRGFQAGGLHSWRENYCSTYLFQTHPFITLASCFGIIAAIRRRDAKVLALAWFPLYAVLLSMARSRYLIPFFPLLTLLAAYGLEEIKWMVIRRYIVAIAVLFSLMLTYGAYLPFFKTTSMMNLKLAGEYIDSLHNDSVVVRTLPQHRSKGATTAAIPLLALYTDKKLLLENPESSDGLPKEFTHPLQFTESMPLTSFAPAKKTADLPTLIIGDEKLALNRAVPSAGCRVNFFLNSGVFRYQTLVSISMAGGTRF